LLRHVCVPSNCDRRGDSEDDLKEKRNAASLVAGQLQDKGPVRSGRGKIRIVDAVKLKAAACECYSTVRDELEHLKRSMLH
jgi:hypothetical protein